MPEDIRKSYMMLVSKLEGLADGAKKHAGDAGFPPEASEEKVRAMKTDLESAMERWKQTQADASKYKNDYEALEDVIDGKVSQLNSSIYGHFGKKNAQVKDFGLKPYKERTATKNGVQPTA
jgi:hypothetical protein